MQLKEFRLLFPTGTLKSACVVPSPMESGYLLLIDEQALLAQRGGVRVFKTIDAAVFAARDIGFSDVSCAFN